MKQILQNLRTGATEVADIPAPSPRAGDLLIRTSRTLVSVGTERMLVEFGKAGWISKARQQPEKVRMVVEKVRTDGLMPTVEAVFNKLEQPIPLGYCNVGIVMEAGLTVTGFDPGDRVVSNGSHAEVVSVPKNLCAKVPGTVTDDEAAFTVIGAIALQGIRLVQPSLGEAVVVTGLGLIGLITVQLLRAHGCRVLGIDFDPAKLELARRFGAEVVDLPGGEDPVAAAMAFSRGRGVDAVILTAATKSSEPVHQAALMCRKRGRIVLVGVTGLELSRADFYEKELSFQVSCSYGPGRYDPSYEEKGIDYPVGFVRWTEQRNFEAVLDMMSDGRLDVKPLVSHRIPIADADEAYDVVTGGGAALGILLEYPSPQEQADDVLRGRVVRVAPPPPPPPPLGAGAGAKASVGFIGSGNYATAILIPAFKAAGAQLHTVVSRAGVSGFHAARKYGFQQTSTDHDAVFSDTAANVVVIATRHDTHADLAIAAIQAGKHVFVEKPLALTYDELDRISSAREKASAAGAAPLVMVGFNRRFAPHVRQMKSLLASVAEPKVILITINAGAVPPEHWTQDPATGGGRIVGEGCHFIDLARHLAGSPIASLQASSVGAAPGVAVTEDKSSITLRFEDGSLATILYLANGHKSFPKERVEVFAAGRILQLDNFRRLDAFGWPGFKPQKLWRQDKGQRECAAAFVRAVESAGPSPISFDELMEVSRASIDAAESLR